MVWHDLRHTANTLAADAGASQATLQTRMGHADPKVSAIYLHTSRSHDRELAGRLNQMAGHQDQGEESRREYAHRATGLTPAAGYLSTHGRNATPAHGSSRTVPAGQGPRRPQTRSGASSAPGVSAVAAGLKTTARTAAKVSGSRISLSAATTTAMMVMAAREPDEGPGPESRPRHGRHAALVSHGAPPLPGAARRRPRGRRARGLLRPRPRRSARPAARRSARGPGH